MASGLQAARDDRADFVEHAILPVAALADHGLDVVFALILDDLGLRLLSQEETIDLYDIIRLRYERSSTIITSNRALDEWPAIFGDPLLSSAALDRLLDEAHVIVIEGDSYRNPPPQKRPAKRRGRRKKSEAPQ